MNRPPLGSKWRHADGGLYVVTGYYAHKSDLTGDWEMSVAYDHADGNRNVYGVPYGTTLKRWYERFSLFAMPDDLVIKLG